MSTFLFSSHLESHGFGGHFSSHGFGGHFSSHVVVVANACCGAPESAGVASIADKTSTAVAGINTARLFALGVDMCVFTSQ